MPVLNEESHLADSIAAILRQDYPSAIEMILALGPSRDETNAVAKKLAKQDKRIKLLDNPRGLTTVGMNAAIKIAKHDIIVRVDAHSEPMDGYLKNGVRILLEQNADEVGGIMDAQGRSSFQKAVAWAYKSRLGIGGASYHVGGEAGEAESAYLGIFRKSALIRVGGYDEEIIRGEDWDLAQRIKADGGKVWFSPELRVVYWPRGRFSNLAKQFYSTGVWRGDLTRRDPANASLRYWVPPLLVVATILGVPLGLYVFTVLAAGLLARGLSLKSRIALLIVLPTMHYCWGFGFLIGFITGARGTLDRSRVSK